MDASGNSTGSLFLWPISILAVARDHSGLFMGRIIYRGSDRGRVTRPNPTHVIWKTREPARSAP